MTVTPTFTQGARRCSSAISAPGEAQEGGQLGRVGGEVDVGLVGDREVAHLVAQPRSQAAQQPAVAVDHAPAVPSGAAEIGGHRTPGGLDRCRDRHDLHRRHRADASHDRTDVGEAKMTPGRFQHAPGLRRLDRGRSGPEELLVGLRLAAGSRVQRHPDGTRGRRRPRLGRPGYCPGPGPGAADDYGEQDEGEKQTRTAAADGETVIAHRGQG